MACKDLLSSACSINICGLSERSKFMLNHFIDAKKIVSLVVQETGTDDMKKLELLNIQCYKDTNSSLNRGAALYISQTLKAFPVPEIGMHSNQIDSAWALVELGSIKVIIGSLYVKLNYIHAIQEAYNLIFKANELCSKLHADGVIALGDFNARHHLWGDHQINSYGQQLTKCVDFAKYSIKSSGNPMFLSKNRSSCIDLAITSNSIIDRFSDCYTDDHVLLYSGAPLRGHVPLL